VGDQLKCVFIDTGFFRKNEPETILRDYQDWLGVPIELLDAKGRFMEVLAGVGVQKEKERLTTSVLDQILVEQCTGASDTRTIVLGTNLNDTFYDSGAGFSQIPPLICEADYCVVEPIIGLFKEEVRRLAAALSLPASVSERQAFPSGGLALHIMGEISEKKLNLLRAADAIFHEEILAGGHEKRLWQYHASLLEAGAMGGGHTIALRALQAAQGDAYAARLPYDMLERVTKRILADVPEIIRVIYDLTPGMQAKDQE
jgi:GMP synthase (glutamine-hydrolysing)